MESILLFKSANYVDPQGSYSKYVELNIKVYVEQLNLGTTDLRRVLDRIATNYLQTSPPQSREEFFRFLEYMEAVRLIISGHEERPSSPSVMSTTGPEIELEEIPKIATLQERKVDVESNIKVYVEQLNLGTIDSSGVLTSIAMNYLQTTPPHSAEEHSMFVEYLKEMRLILSSHQERPSSPSVMSTTGPERELEEIPKIVKLQERKESLWNNKVMVWPEFSTTFPSPRAPEETDPSICSSEVLKVTILADEWKSLKGGLSTLNRELAIHLAKRPEVRVTILVPHCASGEEEKAAAAEHCITIIRAKKLIACPSLVELFFPPKDLRIDVVIGHGVKLGQQAQIIKESHD
ncbi:hypothetical protein AWC38_SpisGene23510 [Stylophora pistillata]|uniref:Uncharacterized protein n=1 Tax=Stylophora pistillata TaxID=50429 RepID=A0A2B4R7Q9_STYPI|nr:hypothetical protein AWC38_SpisGene23510 [Stylophora pistillata]